MNDFFNLLGYSPITSRVPLLTAEVPQEFPFIGNLIMQRDLIGWRMNLHVNFKFFACHLKPVTYYHF